MVGKPTDHDEETVEGYGILVPIREEVLRVFRKAATPRPSQAGRPKKKR